MAGKNYEDTYLYVYEASNKAENISITYRSEVLNPTVKNPRNRVVQDKTRMSSVNKGVVFTLKDGAAASSPENNPQLLSPSKTILVIPEDGKTSVVSANTDIAIANLSNNNINLVRSGRGGRTRLEGGKFNIESATLGDATEISATHSENIMTVDVELRAAKVKDSDTGKEYFQIHMQKDKDADGKPIANAHLNVLQLGKDAEITFTRKMGDVEMNLTIKGEEAIRDPEGTRQRLETWQADALKQDGSIEKIVEDTKAYKKVASIYEKVASIYEQAEKTKDRQEIAQLQQKRVMLVKDNPDKPWLSNYASIVEKGKQLSGYTQYNLKYVTDGTSIEFHDLKLDGCNNSKHIPEMNLPLRDALVSGLRFPVDEVEANNTPPTATPAGNNALVQKPRNHLG